MPSGPSNRASPRLYQDEAAQEGLPPEADARLEAACKATIAAAGGAKMRRNLRTVLLGSTSISALLPQDTSVDRAVIRRQVEKFLLAGKDKPAVPDPAVLGRRAA